MPWNVDPGAIDLGRPLQVPVDQAQLPTIVEYEREAASYALFMLHSIGITGVDQWFSDYTSGDHGVLGPLLCLRGGRLTSTVL